jgi:AraC-like DNA-binding protein
MQQLTRPPCAALRPYVRLLWAWAPTGAAAERPGAREHVLPTGGMHLVFRLSGPPLMLFGSAADTRGQSFGHAIVGGARSAFYLRDVSVATRSIGAQLAPGAARMLLGAPEGALAATHTPLDALWGQAQADAALEQLHAAPSLERQLAVFEALLAQRIAAALRAGLHGLHPGVASALGLLDRAREVSMADLAARSGLSHRHFIARFREGVGLAPKEYARVKRFDRALALAADPHRSWTDIAFAAGYSDQAHLSRAFSVFAGMPPQAWRRQGSPSPRHVPAVEGQIRSRQGVRRIPE